MLQSVTEQTPILGNMNWASVPSEGTVRPVTCLAALAQTAVAQIDQFFLRQLISRKYLRKKHIEDSSGKAYGRSGNAHDRYVTKVSYQSHIARL